MGTESRGLLRRARGALVRPILAHVARAYIAGETLQDAKREAARWAARGLPATLGFWDDARDGARRVADEYLASFESLPEGDYVSIKVTALRYDTGLLEEIGRRALPQGTRVHFDAMDPGSVEPTRQAIDYLLVRFPGLPIGTTLPGCWERSPRDAAWAVERRLAVRVVKGQFPDGTVSDPRAGFEAVVAALAGKAARVGVATHDEPLARACLRRLAEAGTPRELELLHGLPTRRSLRGAAALGEKARVYVGYGRAHLPYVVGKVLENPRMMVWLARDMLRL